MNRRDAEAQRKKWNRGWTLINADKKAFGLFFSAPLHLCVSAVNQV
jgi:hypothetical protein